MDYICIVCKKSVRFYDLKKLKNLYAMKSLKSVEQLLLEIANDLNANLIIGNDENICYDCLKDVNEYDEILLKMETIRLRLSKTAMIEHNSSNRDGPKIISVVGNEETIMDIPIKLESCESNEHNSMEETVGLISKTVKLENIAVEEESNQVFEIVAFEESKQVLEVKLEKDAVCTANEEFEFLQELENDACNDSADIEFDILHEPRSRPDEESMEFEYGQFEDKKYFDANKELSVAENPETLVNSDKLCTKNPKRFVCYVCEEVVCDEVAWKKHACRFVETNTNKKCNQCKRLYKNEARHRSIFHAKTYLQCDTCHIVLKNKYYYDLHMNLHKGKTELQCPFCDRIYKFKNSVVRHMILSCARIKEN